MCKDNVKYRNRIANIKKKRRISKKKGEHGSPDKSGGQPRLAWKAIHIGFADVGNRVDTRNDSDEDVRGYACNQAIAWKALPWSFIT